MAEDSLTMKVVNARNTELMPKSVVSQKWEDQIGRLTMTVSDLSTNVNGIQFGLE